MGCGDEPSSEGSLKARESPPGLAGGELTLVAALGDSIVAGSPGYDPDPNRRAELGFGNDERSQFSYWAERSDPALEFRNCGAFGERTDEIALRLDECAEGAGVLLVQGGINDIAQALASGPQAAVDAAEQAAPEIGGMLERGAELDLDLAVTEVLPWTNGHPQADHAIAILNRRIARLAKQHDAKLLRWHDALADTNVQGTFAPGLTDDGDHPSIEGYRILGEVTADALR